jgi:hypothetical protein
MTDTRMFAAAPQGIKGGDSKRMITKLRARLLIAALLLGAAPSAFAADRDAGLREAASLLAEEGRDAGRTPFTPETAVKFNPDDNVYVTSALAVDFTYGQATVTLPLFKGFAPSGDPVYYVLTDASDFEVARRMGLNFSPKLANAAGSKGAQTARLEDGHLHFLGNIDFARKYQVKPGIKSPFPPSVAVPGAVADGDWSSIVALPSGVVLNAQIVHNNSGNHLRLQKIDLQHMTVTLSVLDGFEDGKQYFYHLVTDVSADVPSVIEKGVYAPRLASLPSFGHSVPGDGSALLGFSPVANGITDVSTGQAQGFAASLANGGIDPINVFPVGPNNADSSGSNNYSPLWDAHVVVWTDQAMQKNLVRRITSFADLSGLIQAGLVTSAAAEGPGNPFVFGINPLHVVINCPVIAHPLSVRR